MAKSTQARQYWLLKSEPDCFSFDDLLAAPKRRTAWDGVRNHQAKLFLRDAMRVGDGVLFHHSSAQPPGIAGVARVCSAPRADETQFDPAAEHFDPKSRRESPTWFLVEIEACAKLPRFLTLDELRAQPELAQMALLQRGQRLSVMPVREEEWRAVLRLSGLRPTDF